MLERMALTEAAGLILGWMPLQEPSPCKDVARQIGMDVPPEKLPRWTYPLLMKAFDHLAKETKRTPASFRRKVCDNLSAKLTRIESRLEDLRRQEQSLVDQMRSERDHAIAVNVYSTENAVAKIQQAENHLNRQLGRSLAILDRFQSRRRAAEIPVLHRRDDPLLLAGLGADRPDIGFVFHPGSLPARDREERSAPRQAAAQEQDTVVPLPPVSRPLSNVIDGELANAQLDRSLPNGVKTVDHSVA